MGWRAACKAQQVVSAPEEKRTKKEKKLPRLKSGSKRHSANAKSFMLSPTLSSLFFSSAASMQQQQRRQVFFKAVKTQAGEAPQRYTFFCAHRSNPEHCDYATLMAKKKKERKLSFSFGYNKWWTQNLTSNPMLVLHQLNILEKRKKIYKSQSVFSLSFKESVHVNANHREQTQKQKKKQKNWPLVTSNTNTLVPGTSCNFFKAAVSIWSEHLVNS